LLFAVPVVLLLVLATQAVAVPTFARRYQTSCATCHQAFPRLNAVGESFRLAGFRFVDDERYRKVEPVELGDEVYKRLWPEALWPGDVPRHSPLSFISRFMVEIDADGSRPSTTTFLLPEEMELVWAGNLGDDISFYGDVIYLQKDFGGADPDAWATVKSWVQLQSLFGPPNKLNLRIGSVGTQTMGLFTARDANFYGTHYYLYTSWFLPPVPAAAAGLASFNGNNFTIGPQAGIELNGVGERWFYAVGVANGNLEVPLGQPPSSDISFYGMGRGSDLGDFYTQLAYKIGGQPLDRSAEEPTEELTTGAEFWRDDSLILSLYGYLGQADVEAIALDGTTTVTEDDFWRLAVGAQQQIRDLSVSAAYMVGTDDRPYAPFSDESVDSTAWHVEVLYFAYPWLIPFARYEGLDLDLPPGLPGLDPQQDAERIIAGAKAMIRPNVSFTLEGAHYTKGADLEEGFDGTIFALFALSF
jgi:hypothetical protein